MGTNLLRGRLLFVGFLLVRSALGTEPVEALPNGYQAIGPDRQKSIDELCQATAETGLFSGAVLVSVDAKIIYQQAFGYANREWNVPNTTDTKFRIASVSKPFCSTVVLQLVQEGKLQLTDTVSSFLPYYRKDIGERVTIHHLLSHQSGIRDFTSSFNYRSEISRQSYRKDEFIEKFCSGELEHEPGTIYSYSNAGYVILGRIVEKVTRKSFEQNLQERIFNPLKMDNSGYDRNQTIILKRASGYTYGPFGIENSEYLNMETSPGAAGALYSTVEDLFLWDRALETNQILNEKYRKLMFTPNKDVPEVKAAGGRPHSRYGYGWNIYKRTHPVTKKGFQVITHGGAINGFRAMFIRIAEKDALVVVLSNQGDEFGQSRVWNEVVRLSYELMNIATDQPYRMPASPGLTQEQRVYELAKTQSVEAAMKWFQEKGKKSAWGGANLSVAKQLIQDGRIDDGIQLMEFDITQTPGKIWLFRNAARASLENGRPEKARQFVQQGLELRPDDEEFQLMLMDLEQDKP